MFVVNEKPHAVFRRDGDDLIHTLHIGLVDALCGTTLNVPHLSGSTVQVPLTDIVSPNSTKVIR